MNFIRNKPNQISGISLLILFFLISPFIQSRAQIIQPGPPPELKGVDVTEHLGEKIPLDLTFTNDSGEKVALRQYFNQGKPVIIVMAYYTCPMLCTLVLNGVATGLHNLDLEPGKDFQVLTISIDTSETVELAKAKKENLLTVLGKAGGDSGWRFFVGEEPQIRALADTLGFHYYYDKKMKQFAHPAVVMVLTPDGRISRYLYGVEFKKQELKLALLEASEGKLGTTIDRIILYCYHYNPEAKGYVLFAGNLMKLGGVLTIVAIAMLLLILWRREFKRKPRQAVAH
jgi:protein SCO1